jgi:hypothetical protein
MGLSRSKRLRLLLVAFVLLAVAVAMTASTAVVDIGSGPFEIWSLGQAGSL